MASNQNHYQVLGLSPDASPEEVKRKYRELARRHHPDLNPNKPDAHALFLRINQAHETLSDPNLRAAYDLDLRKQSRRDAESRSRDTGRPTSSASRPGAGARTSGPTAPGDIRAERLAAERRRMAARSMDAARFAFGRGNLREADRLARESLNFARSGSAHEMLGDIYARQGRSDKALQHYTLAAQLSPNNGPIMAKLQRLTAKMGGRGGGGGTRTAGSSASGSRNRGAAQTRQGMLVRSMARFAHRSIVTSLGFLAIVLILTFSRYFGGGRSESSFPTDLPMAQLIGMALAGFFAGATLAAGAWVRRFPDEMVVSAGNPPRILPLGFVLGLFGAVGAPFALVVYLFVAYFQSFVSLSVLGVFASTAILTALFTLFHEGSAVLGLFWFGGNIVFVCMLIGWWFGEVLRPGWSG